VEEVASVRCSVDMGGAAVVRVEERGLSNILDLSPFALELVFVFTVVGAKNESRAWTTEFSEEDSMWFSISAIFAMIEGIRFMLRGC